MAKFFVFGVTMLAVVVLAMTFLTAGQCFLAAGLSFVGMIFFGRIARGGVGIFLLCVMLSFLVAGFFMGFSMLVVEMK